MIFLILPKKGLFNAQKTGGARLDRDFLNKPYRFFPP